MVTYEAMKPTRGQHRQREQQRDGALGALGGPLVDVLDAGLVRRQPGVGERVVRDGYRAVRRLLLAGQRSLLARSRVIQSRS